jgi:RND family efflux transporter MFP subunit
LASVSNAEGDLESAKNSLELIISSPDEEDIKLYEAQVEKAQTKIDYLSEQINDSYIVSPLGGQISEVVKRQGEMVSAGSKVLGFLPESSFQVEVDIYEEDIVKMDVGNPVEISFIAFPEEVFQGEVFFISPVEKIVDGVVYYEVKIEFKEVPEGIKPGMTADLKIETESKENVLYVPESAIQKKEGKRIVKVFKEGETEEREVKIGLEGSDGSVEIISGISEGEKIILE